MMLSMTCAIITKSLITCARKRIAWTLLSQTLPYSPLITFQSMESNVLFSWISDTQMTKRMRSKMTTNRGSNTRNSKRKKPSSSRSRESRKSLTLMIKANIQTRQTSRKDPLHRMLRILQIRKSSLEPQSRLHLVVEVALLQMEVVALEQLLPKRMPKQPWLHSEREVHLQRISLKH